MTAQTQNLEDLFATIIPTCLGPAIEHVSLTAWRGVYSVAKGKTATYTWPALAADFEKFATTVTPKLQQVYFAQGVSPTGVRNNASMTEMTIIALDADHVGGWSTLRETLEHLGLAFVLYQSSGHADGIANKWRCLIPLTRPYDVSAEEGRHLWRHAYSHLASLFGYAAGLSGDGFDPSLAKVSQPVFVGCRKSESAANRVVIWSEGASFDLHRFVAALPDAPAFKPSGVPTGDFPALGYLFQAAGTLGEERADKYPVICPWNDEHSSPLSDDAEPTSATVVLPPTEGHTLGVFKCLHGSCEGRWSREHVAEKLGPEIAAEAQRLETAAREALFPKALPASQPSRTLPPRVEEVLRSDAFARPQATYPTSYPELNHLIAGGLKSRQAFIVAGPTGAGKTGFATCIARDLSKHVPVLFVCTEIDEAEQSARFVAIERGCTPDDILAGRIPTDIAAQHVKDLRVHIYNLDWLATDGLDLIAEKVQAMKDATGCAPAVVVDYLQMVASEDPDARRLSVSGVANKLRALAQHFDVPVIAVSSVSRAFYGQNKKLLEKEEDPRAWLASAKESGDIEYAAAVFAFLDVGDEGDLEHNRPARLIVAKSRRGQVGFVGLKFHGPSGAFVADPASNVVLSGSTRAEEKASQQAERDQEKILATISKHGGRVQKARLKERAGVKGTNFYSAIDELLDAGRIREEDGKAENGRLTSFFVLGSATN